MIKILFICHGNICRSPMAEFVLKDMVEKLGIKDDFYIESAATSRDEIWGKKGNPIYEPAKKMLRQAGIGMSDYTDFSKKRARQIVREDYDRFDYILCADSQNINNVLKVTGRDFDDKIHLMLDYSDEHGNSISDPWYTRDFEKAYRDVRYACISFLEYLGYNCNKIIDVI